MDTDSHEVETDAARSSFERWLIRTGLTQAAAAKRLRISLRQVTDYTRGVSQHTGNPITPPYAVRVLMTAIERGRVPDAWPE